MTLTTFPLHIDPEGCCADPSRVSEIARAFGLRVVQASEMERGRTFAQSRFEWPIAPVSSFAAVQEITGASVFGFEEQSEFTGFVALFPLRRRGLSAIEDCSFNSLDVDLDLVCRPGETPSAIYSWGFVASTKPAGRAVVKGLAAIQTALFWAIPKYCHVASADGERVVVGKMGYRRVGGSDPHSAVIPPIPRPTEIAA